MLSLNGKKPPCKYSDQRLQMEDTFKPQGPKLSPYSSDLKCTALSNSLCCSYCALLNLDFMNSPRKQLIQDSCLFCTEYYKLKSFKKRYPRNFWSHSVFGEWAKYKIILNASMWIFPTYWIQSWTKVVNVDSVVLFWPPGCWLFSWITSRTVIMICTPM